MDPKKIAKRISLYESGLLSAREWANSLLCELVSAPELDTALVSSVDSLPHDVGREFRSLLGRIEEADFHWTPFLIPPSTVASDPTEYSAELRQVCALLGRGGADNGGQRPAEPVSRKAVGAATASGTVADPD